MFIFDRPMVPVEIGDRLNQPLAEQMLSDSLLIDYPCLKLQDDWHEAILHQIICMNTKRWRGNTGYHN